MHPECSLCQIDLKNMSLLCFRIFRGISCADRSFLWAKVCCQIVCLSSCAFHLARFGSALVSTCMQACFRSLLTFPPIISFARCPGSNLGCLLPMQFCSNHVRQLHGCKWTPWLLSSYRRPCAIARSARRDRHFNHKATHQLCGGCRMLQASFVSGHNACVARLVAHGFWAAGHTPTVAKAAW